VKCKDEFRSADRLLRKQMADKSIKARIEHTSLSPGRLFLRRLGRNRAAVASAAILAILYLSALLAGFIAPYAMDRQNRQASFHQPIGIRWSDECGWSWRPFVYDYRSGKGITGYEKAAGKRYYVRFFVRGDKYKLLGLIPSDRHLFGIDAPGKLYLLGTDRFGRDIFSRLLYGAQISLSIGLVGIIITFFIGLTVGGISGYYGGAVDNLIMRFSELVMAFPSFYLILAIMAVLPTGMASSLRYLLMICVLSFIGWAGMARVIRGMVLSIRERDYVTAARSQGVSDWRIITRHLLPNTVSYVIVAITLSLPGYILGEVALSFLGMGIQEPMASWGNMLQAAQNIRVLTSYPWMLAPGAMIFITVLSFNLLGDGLRDALDPR